MELLWNKNKTNILWQIVYIEQLLLLKRCRLKIYTNWVQLQFSSYFLGSWVGVCGAKLLGIHNEIFVWSLARKSFYFNIEFI